MRKQKSLFYPFVNLISLLIRLFVLPNPYINYFNNNGYAELFNILVGGVILHYSSFIMSGCIYRKGIDDPSVGSIGYLISYAYMTLVIMLIGKFISNYILAIVIFLIIYIVSCLLISSLSKKNKIDI